MIWLNVPSGRRIDRTTRNSASRRDHVVDLRDPPIGQDHGQVDGVAFDDLEVGQRSEAIAEQAGEVAVALDHEHPRSGPRPLGEHSRDRARAGSQLDQMLGPIPVDVADGRPGEPPARGREARDGIAPDEAGEEFTEKERGVVHASQIRPGGVPARKPTRRSRASRGCRTRHGSSAGGTDLSLSRR